MTHWKEGGHKRECRQLKAAAEAEAEAKASLPTKKKEDDANKEEADGDKEGANDANEMTTSTATTATNTTTSTTTTTFTTTAAAAAAVAAAAGSSPVLPEEEDEDGKESATASTATTSSPPPRTYVENLTCCVCMDEVPVDDNAFTRMTCCGKAMHKHCDERVEGSTMSRAQKDRCHECRTVYPSTEEGTVKQVRVWVDKGKPWAETFLASQYRFGEGVPQSYEKAIEYYNMAIKQGDPTAMDDLEHRNHIGIC